MSISSAAAPGTSALLTEPDGLWPLNAPLPPLPARFPSPFDELGPHPLAQRAALFLRDRLAAGELAPGLPSSILEGPHAGKMFGVLVVRDAHGRLGALHAFSGMLAGRWTLPGYCPPLFDPQARGALEGPGAAVVESLDRRHRTLELLPEALATTRALKSLQAAHAQAREALHALHRQRREARAARRQALQPASVVTAEEALDAPPRQRREGHATPLEALLGAGTTPAQSASDALHALDQESRADKAQKRELLAAQARELAPLLEADRRHQRRLRASARLRRHVSARLMRGLHDTYRLPNAQGEHRSLREVFSPIAPPSGAGDCAAPKLLAEAYRRGLQPLALAEFFWGSPPPAGGQVHGAWAPACRGKCGPILDFMLRGLDVAPARRFAPPDPSDLRLRIVHQDAHLVVVDKPAGLLSVPGRSPAHRDSVRTRIQELLPHARGPLLVHRLDLDTSGLLVAALTPEVHRDLQRQFLERTVEKRYLAVLERAPEHLRTQGGGEIHLALRGDPELRPRQTHDPVHGKPAHTSWRLLATDNGRARVELRPHTGRTHQLRVHAAHPLGLGVAILGDRLYGREDSRLHLHAAGLALRHPVTGQRLEWELASPF